MLAPVVIQEEVHLAVVVIQVAVREEVHLVAVEVHLVAVQVAVHLAVVVIILQPTQLLITAMVQQVVQPQIQPTQLALPKH